MKKSFILHTAVKYLFPLMLLFSFFLLVRGHNEPGGGFVGGLVASAAFALYAIANGVEEAKKILRVKPIRLISVGLLIAFLSGLIGPLTGGQFKQGIWSDFQVPVLGKLGTPLLFDVGVFILVMGIAVLIIFTLVEEEE